jgi:hypothetical protein
MDAVAKRSTCCFEGEAFSKGDGTEGAGGGGGGGVVFAVSINGGDVVVVVGFAQPSDAVVAATKTMRGAVIFGAARHMGVGITK